MKLFTHSHIYFLRWEICGGVNWGGGGAEVIQFTKCVTHSCNVKLEPHCILANVSSDMEVSSYFLVVQSTDFQCSFMFCYFEWSSKLCENSDLLLWPQNQVQNLKLVKRSNFFSAIIVTQNQEQSWKHKRSSHICTVVWVWNIWSGVLGFILNFSEPEPVCAGIAFPTCISVNNCICHFSPLKSDPDVTVQDGDMVKM